jgi:hypothetical protein
MKLSVLSVMFEINKAIISNNLMKLRILLYLLLVLSGKIKLSDLYRINYMCMNRTDEVNKEVQMFTSFILLGNNKQKNLPYIIPLNKLDYTF